MQKGTIEKYDGKIGKKWKKRIQMQKWAIEERKK